MRRGLDGGPGAGGRVMEGLQEPHTRPGSDRVRWGPDPLLGLLHNPFLMRSLGCGGPLCLQRPSPAAGEA